MCVSKQSSNDFIIDSWRNSSFTIQTFFQLFCHWLYFYLLNWFLEITKKSSEDLIHTIGILGIKKWLKYFYHSLFFTKWILIMTLYSNFDFTYSDLITKQVQSCSLFEDGRFFQLSICFVIKWLSKWNLNLSKASLSVFILQKIMSARSILTNFQFFFIPNLYTTSKCWF